MERARKGVALAQSHLERRHLEGSVNLRMESAKDGEARDCVRALVRRRTAASVVPWASESLRRLCCRCIHRVQSVFMALVARCAVAARALS